MISIMKEENQLVNKYPCTSQTDSVYTAVAHTDPRSHHTTRRQSRTKRVPELETLETISVRLDFLKCVHIFIFFKMQICTESVSIFSRHCADLRY